MEDISGYQLSIATVTQYGLQFMNSYYTNQVMLKNQWFACAAEHGEWQIPVLYKKEDNSQIVLLELGSMEIATTIEADHSKLSSDVVESYQEAICTLKEQLQGKRQITPTLE